MCDNRSFNAICKAKLFTDGVLHNISIDKFYTNV